MKCGRESAMRKRERRTVSVRWDVQPNRWELHAACAGYVEQQLQELRAVNLASSSSAIALHVRGGRVTNWLFIRFCCSKSSFRRTILSMSDSNSSLTPMEQSEISAPGATESMISIYLDYLWKKPRTTPFHLPAPILDILRPCPLVHPRSNCCRNLRHSQTSCCDTQTAKN